LAGSCSCPVAFEVNSFLIFFVSEAFTNIATGYYQHANTRLCENHFPPFENIEPVNGIVVDHTDY
jgi:hypothetical protein